MTRAIREASAPKPAAVAHSDLATRLRAMADEVDARPPLVNVPEVDTLTQAEFVRLSGATALVVNRMAKAGAALTVALAREVWVEQAKRRGKLVREKPKATGAVGTPAPPLPPVIGFRCTGEETVRGERVKCPKRYRDDPGRCTTCGAPVAAIRRGEV